jgi:hypothetical protein
VMVACVCGAAVALLSTARADGPTCGEKGQPACPLEEFMEKSMELAEEKGDAKALAAAYEKLVAMAPDPKWNEGENSWAKISKAGAEAASKGDLVAAKAQCKSCHKAWRKQYKATFRSKPLPK